jgi:serine-type D-Ala-D-Ala carboxypeptidase/endopeptidase (penicillin-binding protein 4)
VARHRRSTSRLPLFLAILALLAGALVAVVPGMVAPASAQDRDTLGKDLDAILADPGLTNADVGLVVRTLDGETLYTRGSERRQQPASNAKLVTSAVALEVLGPDYRFDTTAAAGGAVSGGVLDGDLYLRGTGDPTMLAKDYDALAAEIAAAGVTTVTGGLVADDTWFDGVRLGSGWAWDDEPYYYSAQTSALTVAPDTDYDAGSIIVNVAPGAEGEPAVVTTDPPTDYVTVRNTAVTGAAGSEAAVTVDRVHGGNTITVSGSVPAGGTPAKEWITVWEPTGYAAAVFRSALGAHGVTVTGPTTTGATPPEATRLAAHQSMPLVELQVPFLKLSNNMHAETLMKAMGRKTADEGSWSAGAEAVAATLPDLGVDPAAVSLVDGSGLSRMDQIAPDQLASLLVSASGKPWFGQWYEALPIAGKPDRLVGGTLRNRMRGTPAEGKVHAKTGSLTGVSSLSGYVDSASGERLVFSMVTNNTIGLNTKVLEDAVAIRLAGESGDGARTAPAPRIEDSPSNGAARRLELECSWVKAC